MRIVSERLPDTEGLSEEFTFVRDYLADLQGARPMPRRSDFDPAAIRLVLPRTLLLQPLQGGDDFKIKVAGSEYRVLLGYESTGLLVSQWTPADYRDHILSELRDLMRVRRLVHRRISLVNVLEERRLIHVIRFPMSETGDAVDHILCVFRILTSPR